MTASDMLADAKAVLRRLSACDATSVDPDHEAETARVCDQVASDDLPRLRRHLADAGLETIEVRRVRDPANPPSPGMRCSLMAMDIATAFEPLERRA